MLEHVVLAAEAATPTLDTAVVEQVVSIAKTALSLLGTFPMNLFLAGAIIGIGFAVIRKAKGVAK